MPIIALSQHGSAHVRQAAICAGNAAVIIEVRSCWCLVPQGVWLRDYTPVTERREGDDDYRGADMGKVPPSNAYQRRVAGAQSNRWPLRSSLLGALSMFLL